MALASWLRLSHNGQAEYTRLAEDVELEKRHLFEASSDASSENNDTVPFYRQYTETRIPRHRNRLVAIVVIITVVAASLASISSHRSKQTRKDKARSALPEWPLPFTTDAAFSEEALDMWISQGRLPSTLSSDKVDLSSYTRIDGITFWVNGSDPHHRAARNKYADQVDRIDYPPSRRIHRREMDRDKELQNTDQRYREQNELLYSLRSSRMNLEGLGTMHVVATDYWNDGSKQMNGIQDRFFDGRRGQVPSWLDMSSKDVAYGNDTRIETPALRLHHDWETFVPLVDAQEDIEKWKERRLPSFNSMAAEAVLGVNLPGLAEYSILASDDMFLGRPMSTADFVTPLYGPVLQLKMDQQIEYPRTTPMTGIEFASLDFSIGLLNKRFGTRLFPYLHHVHKTLSKPLLIESRMMWKAELEEASLKRFRGNGITANSHVLSYGLIIERHREALLWSFLVAKVDVDGDGKLDNYERERAYKLMGTDGQSDIVAHLNKRTTSDPASLNQTLESASFPLPKSVRYIFSSFDGHVLNQPSANFTSETGHRITNEPIHLWQQPSEENSKLFSTEYCRVKMSTCWPRSNDVSDIFTHIAFEEPTCGDCLVSYLVEQSGDAGLEAFLPDTTTPLVEAVDPEQQSNIPDWVPAHLSIEEDWRSIDFSLSSVAAINRVGWNRRAFSVHLIQRYKYVAGDASVSFKMLFNPQSATDVLTEIQHDRPVFICLNDDIEDKVEETRTVMQSFFKFLWPSKAPFEKTL